MTLIGGPKDTRISPDRFNELAMRRPIRFFERLISAVPAATPWPGRSVYPGVVQLAGFMNMHPRRHLRAHHDLCRDLVSGNATRAFYDGYGAVMDVPAEFYLEAVQRIFQEHLLVRGELTWRGQSVESSAVTRTALLTVEGIQDEICSPGQTRAAHQLCSNSPDELRRHHLQPGVGHYGVFSGSCWEQQVYPVVRSFIASREAVAAT
jgi:poly(3-hydroxybutyrate) depolymerase